MNLNTTVRGGALRCVHPVTVSDRQRGASLFIALVALVLMTIAGFSLMRSVDTGNVIAGNLAFREVTVHAADLGIEAAATYLNSTVAPSPDADLPSSCVVADMENSTRGTCLYSARELPEDENGVPYVDWASVTTIPATTTNGVTYQFVVDRLCNPDTSVSINAGAAAKYLLTKDRCATSVRDEGKSATGGSAYQGGSPSPMTPIHYRVTVRVQGPRNTVSVVQTMMER